MNSELLRKKSAGMADFNHHCSLFTLHLTYVTHSVSDINNVHNYGGGLHLRKGEAHHA